MLGPGTCRVKADADIIDGLTGQLPQVGDTAMHILSPTLLELIKVNTRPANGPVDGTKMSGE